MVRWVCCRVGERWKSKRRRTKINRRISRRNGRRKRRRSSGRIRRKSRGRSALGMLACESGGGVETGERKS